MPRRPFKRLKLIQPDDKYQSLMVARLINKIMQDGKRNKATNYVYTAMDDAAKTLKMKDGLEVLEKAMQNVSPAVQLRSRRVGGANYQVPSEVSPSRKITLAMKWIIDSARNHKGMPIAKRLSKEIVDAFNSTGSAYRKKEDTHKMAEANRAFAHFSRG